MNSKRKVEVFGAGCPVCEASIAIVKQLACPSCDDSWKQEIKPRLRDPGFLEEYAREIRVVAFDQFLYHLQAAHNKDEVDA